MRLVTLGRNFRRSSNSWRDPCWGRELRALEGRRERVEQLERDRDPSRILSGTVPMVF